MTITDEGIESGEYIPDMELIDAVEDVYSGYSTEVHVWTGTFSEASQRVLGLIEGGHGFVTETVATDPTRDVRTACKFCGGRLSLKQKDWLCQFDIAPWDNCECNWCLQRRMWLAYQALDRGRPRVQCGKPECVRAHARERKRNERNRKVQLSSPSTSNEKQPTRVGFRDDGPGTRHAVFPTLRKPSGNYPDPTGDAAVTLAVEPPAVWELVYRLQWHQEHG